MREEGVGTTPSSRCRRFRLAAVPAGGDVPGAGNGHGGGGGCAGAGGLGDVLVGVPRPLVTRLCGQMLSCGDVRECRCTGEGAERKREREGHECLTHLLLLSTGSVSRRLSRRRARTGGSALSARRRQA